MPKAETFEIWKREVDDVMLKEFSINVIDAGLDENQLFHYWQQEPSATAFVAWFGGKYDLVHVSNWGWSSFQGLKTLSR